MACREVEMGKKKCEKYWPALVHDSVQHGAITITMVTMGTKTTRLPHMRGGDFLGVYLGCHLRF